MDLQITEGPKDFLDFRKGGFPKGGTAGWLPRYNWGPVLCLLCDQLYSSI